MGQPTDVIVKSRDLMPQGALTLPAAYYVDHEFFKREMDVLFGHGHHYGRVGLAVIAIGMGFHLCAGTLNQAALARGHARAAATMWLVSAAAFIVWMLLPVVDDELVRAEVGYAGAAALLCALLGLLYRTDRQLTL